MPLFLLFFAATLFFLYGHPPLVAAKTNVPLVIVSPEQAFEVALQHNPELKEKNWAIIQYKIKEEQAKQALLPQVNMLGFVAPVYSAQTDGRDLNNYQIDYYKWGPVLSFQGNILQPIYTFGQSYHGREAARWGQFAMRREKAKRANEIRKEIWDYFWGFQLAADILGLLEEAKTILEELKTKAEEMAKSANKNVSVADLSRIKLFQSKLQEQILDARYKQELASHALARTMGIDKKRIQLKRLSLRISPPLLEPLEYYVQLGIENRPELHQIQAGIHANRELGKMHESSLYPVIGVATQIDASYSPVRSYIGHPAVQDPYNHLRGGAGIGFTWRLNFGETNAKIKETQIKVKEFQSKQQFARLAIPLEIHKAYLDLKKAIQVLKLSTQDIKVAQRWARIAQMDYEAGNQPAKELIEGLAAYLQVRAELKQRYYHVHIQMAELGRTLGQNTLFLKR